MKKLLLALIVVSISGCALVDAYLMTHYDPNEYKLITDIRAEAQLYKSQCDNAEVSKTNAEKLANDTQLFVLYSEHIPRNELLITSSKDLQSIARGLADQYSKANKVSPTFCKIKFNSIETSADKMQSVIARRPR
jgi:hypothetical protein